MSGPPAPSGLQSAGSIALALVRHVLPLVPFYFLGGNTTSYLLLTAFDLALGLILVVGTTRDQKDPTTVDPRAALLVSRITATLVLSLFFGMVATILLIPLGMPAFIFGSAAGVDWIALLSRSGFWLSAGGMMLAAGIRAQRSFESVTTVGELGTSPKAAPVVGYLAADRRNSKAAYAAQVTLIGTYVALCYLLSTFGPRAVFILPALYAALLVFYDARPDLVQRIFPDLWREGKVPVSKNVTRSAQRAKRRGVR
ncbi:MAG: hypothetical protein ABIR71_00535 [Chthoniobacterales bacterium]